MVKWKEGKVKWKEGRVKWKEGMGRWRGGVGWWKSIGWRKKGRGRVEEEEPCLERTYKLWSNLHRNHGAWEPYHLHSDEYNNTSEHYLETAIQG